MYHAAAELLQSNISQSRTAVLLADTLISMVTVICDGSVGRPDRFADSGALYEPSD
jgi:hypothetical protein